MVEDAGVCFIAPVEEVGLLLAERVCKLDLADATDDEDDMVLAADAVVVTLLIVGTATFVTGAEDRTCFLVKEAAGTL